MVIYGRLAPKCRDLTSRPIGFESNPTFGGPANWRNGPRGRFHTNCNLLLETTQPSQQGPPRRFKTKRRSHIEVAANLALTDIPRILTAQKLPSIRRRPNDGG
jgi:hypothetical protein